MRKIEHTQPDKNINCSEMALPADFPVQAKSYSCYNFIPEPKIEFRNVTYSDTIFGKSILKNISFSIGHGRSTVIVGSKNAGKSAIAHLLMRFIDAEDGDILIDGKDIQSYSPYESRDMIGYVPQELAAYDGTIGEYLRHGNLDATVEEMQYALKTVQLEKSITNIDKFVNAHMINDMNLSDEQLQRLSIARAIMKKSSIFVLDDCFSHQGENTLYKLWNTLKLEFEDSVFIVMERCVRAFHNADQIILLDDGKILCQGTHDNLMQKYPVYRQFAEN